MRVLSPQLTAKEGEAAEEGQLGPTKKRATDALPLHQLPTSPRGPGRRLGQTHLLQHTARRLILLRQRQTEGDVETPGEADRVREWRVGKTAIVRTDRGGGSTGRHSEGREKPT